MSLWFDFYLFAVDSSMIFYRSEQAVTIKDQLERHGLGTLPSDNASVGKT